MVDTISTTQYNELQNVFVCCPHIPPNLCICAAAALLSFRPGSLRAWIFLLESPYAPRQQVPLMGWEIMLVARQLCCKKLWSSYVSFLVA